MKTEVSAGGVIVRKREGSWEVLLICDPKGKWTFPKGHLEADESHLDTAIREIGEEVGLHDLTYLADLTPVEYLFTRDGLIKKTVHFFLFTTLGETPLIPQLDEGITDAVWVSLDEAVGQIGYPKTNKPIIQEVLTHLSSSI
jgi:8-oxo-dGTP pyrophosphatase MutT (NUDIX family)